MRLLFLIAMILGLIACRKAPPSLPPEPSTHEMNFNSMKVMVPLTWTEQVREDKGLIYGDIHRHTLALLTEEKCELGRSSCMVLTMRGIANAGFTHVSADDVELNNEILIVLHSHNERVKIWTWLLHRDNSMFYLSCGGPKTDLDIETDCIQIGLTLTVAKTGSITL